MFPYPILAFAALMPWIFFQESASEGVLSVVGNAALIRKIYFPREVFPLTGIMTKLVDLGINVLILAVLMWWFGMATERSGPLGAVDHSLHDAGLAYDRVGRRRDQCLLPGRRRGDARACFPCSCTRHRSSIRWTWSRASFWCSTRRANGRTRCTSVYTLNPLAGIIDSFQNVVLRGLPPDFQALIPGRDSRGDCAADQLSVLQACGILLR